MQCLYFRVILMYAVMLIRIEKIWFNFIFPPSWSFNEWFTNLLVQSTAVPHTFNNMKWKMKSKKKRGKNHKLWKKKYQYKKGYKKNLSENFAKLREKKIWTN